VSRSGAQDDQIRLIAITEVIDGKSTSHVSDFTTRDIPVVATSLEARPQSRRSQARLHSSIERTVKSTHDLTVDRWIQRSHL
jgi:hypothetical protein